MGMSENTPDSNVQTAITPQDFGRGPAAEVKRWVTELELAKSQFRKWWDKSKKNWDRYRARDIRKNSYNCLYANTSIIFPYVYNTVPNPDIRRRYDKGDPIGKCVSEILSRAVEFNNDTTNFDRQVRMSVLDMLICARGLTRVRYVPNMVQVGDVDQTGEEDEETNLAHEAQEGESFEELEWETAPIEHVQWDEYLHGPGRTWDAIPWLAFKHCLTREELCARFGDAIGNQVPLDSGLPVDDQKKYQDDQTFNLFRTATVWEIWDKEARCVHWINTGYRDRPLKTEEDPYGFDGFFPCPEPLIAIVDSDLQSPVSLFEQYEQQADELDRISGRINRITNAIKARGIYDPSMGDQVAQLFRGEDNDLIAADQNIRMLQDAGGIDKFIWFAPLDKMMQVVQGLYAAREQCKGVIYELSGISDIMRGSSDSQETLGAQNLKIAMGKGRVSDMQRNVQRYIRDLLRLQVQVISQRFDVETLKVMTQEKYPTNAEVMAQIAPVLAQMQQAKTTAMLTGQPMPQLPPLPPKPTTWEDIDAVLKSDEMRTFKIDVETDSTIAATQQEDVEAFVSTMGLLSDTIAKLWPMVQQGVLPFEAAKEMAMMVARKSKFGNAMEDVLDQMKAPEPQQPPELQKAQAQAQADMQKHQATLQANAQAHQQDIQADMQMAQFKAQMDQQTAAWEQEVQARENAHQQQLEMERDLAQQRMDMQMQAFKEQAAADRQAMQSQMQILIAQLNNRRAVEVAEIAAATTLQSSQISAAQASTD